MGRPAATLALLTMLALPAGALSCTDEGEVTGPALAGTGQGKGEAPPGKDRQGVLRKLERPKQFLIGHGNDLPGAEKNYDFTQAGIYTLPAKLDIHYVYLTGLAGQGGWPDDNDGNFVSVIANIDVAKGATPMFTLYQMASLGDGDLSGLTSTDFMTKYWKGARRMFEQLGKLGKPAIAHIEPDFWGYAQQRSKASNAATVKVLVKGLVAECKDLPDDLSGFGRCIVRLGRALAPKTLIGLHASSFGAPGNPVGVADFLRACGGFDADIVVLETLDRDAGCFEAKVDPACKRDDGPYYWDETNATSPSFKDHLAWARAIHERTNLPLLWWQTPLGVPSTNPGGSAKKYRDNRVKYFFEHTAEFAAAGGFGAAFGVGAPNQTDITSDGGQFARAVTKYYGAPLLLE